MRFLIIFSHPSRKSFSAALFRTVKSSLKKKGHEVKTIDLYKEEFNPVLSLREWNTYLENTDKNVKMLKTDIDLLLWAEGLIFIFPTWMYGPPAILKGWLERVWLPSIAFDIAPEKKNIPVGKLKNIIKFCVVTTSGSPKWWLWFIGNPGKSMLFKGYKILFNRSCKFKWLQLHDMNHANSYDREKFLNQVSNYFSSI